VLVKLDFTVRFPSVQLLVAEMATALSRADPCLDFQLINDAAAAIVDPDDGSVGAALIELTNGFLMLVVVSLHGMSPFSRRSGITTARYGPSWIFKGLASSVRPIRSSSEGAKRAALWR